MSEQAPYQILLPVFEGPFDLLLHLIRSNEIDIYDIPIAQVTSQDLDYLKTMEALDLEIASSFLVMAATLLAIKAKMLLPPSATEEGEEEAEDAREELVQDLLEYMRFKEAAAELEQLHAAAKLRYTRPNAEELYLNMFSNENPLDGKTLADLSRAFGQVLKRLEKRAAVFDIVQEQVTIHDKITDIQQALQDKPRGLPFSQIFADCGSRAECITAFLALLELIRRARVKISQSAVFSEIYVYATDRAQAAPTA